MGRKGNLAIPPAKGNIGMVALLVAKPCRQIGHLDGFGESLEFEPPGNGGPVLRQGPAGQIGKLLPDLIAGHGRNPAPAGFAASVCPILIAHLPLLPSRCPARAIPPTEAAMPAREGCCAAA